MRTLGMVAWLGLAACAGSGASPDGGRASPADRDGSPWAISVREQTWATSPAGVFTGAWQSCEDAPSPGECSRYVLVQQGDRICGTWSYVASGKSYEGRVVARATSSTRGPRLRLKRDAPTCAAVRVRRPTPNAAADGNTSTSHCCCATASLAILQAQTAHVSPISSKHPRYEASGKRCGQSHGYGSACPTRHDGSDP